MTWFLDQKMLESFDLSSYSPELIAQRTGVTLQQARDFVSPDRMYWVQSSDYNFLAGANGDGLPCLLFVGEPRFASQATHALQFVMFDHKTKELYTEGHDIDLDESSWDDILAVAYDAVGFEHIGRCPVFAFVHPEMWHCAVVPFPWHYHEHVTCDVPDDEEEGVFIGSWIEASQYVMQHGNAYYMDEEGGVESS